jgi:hypothetical protein
MESEPTLFDEHNSCVPPIAKPHQELSDRGQAALLAPSAQASDPGRGNTITASVPTSATSAANLPTPLSSRANPDCAAQDSPA